MNQNIVQPPAKEPFALYIVKHPSFDDADGIARFLSDHFRSDRHKNVVRDVGLSVIYRDEPSPHGTVPAPIEWDVSSVTAVIVLADSNLVNEPEWLEYVNEISISASNRLASTRLFLVMIDSDSLEHGFEPQGIPWVNWAGSLEDKKERLIRTFLHDFIRLFQNHLDSLGRSQSQKIAIGSYTEKVQIFISYSSRDAYGSSNAEAIRKWIDDHSPMSSFLDVRDIPRGLPFGEVLLHEIANSLIVVIYTDTYSSRQWCRREVIEAKRRGVPIVVVDCLQDTDPRSTPYMGNVPVIRANHNNEHWIHKTIECLLSETFETYLWLTLVEQFKDPSANVLFTARPPELITLAQFNRSPTEPGTIIVHPEPTLEPNEAQLFTTIVPEVQFLTLEQWRL